MESSELNDGEWYEKHARPFASADEKKRDRERFIERVAIKLEPFKTPQQDVIERARREALGGV